MPGRLIGYARVSTANQNLDLQIEALKSHGCGETLIFSDHVSGAKSAWPGLLDCLSGVHTSVGDLNLITPN